MPYAWDDNGVAIDHTKLRWDPFRTQKQITRLLAAADKLRVERHYDKAMQAYFKVEHLIRVSQEWGDDLALVYYGMAEVLRLTGNQDEALRVYDVANRILRAEGYRETEPSLSDIFEKIASIYESEGNYSEAMKNYEKALLGRKQYESPEYIFTPGNEATVANEKAIARVQEAQDQNYRP